MTLYQMSFVYREDAVRFRMRITALRQRAGSAPKEEAQQLKRRIADLQMLMRQSRELAELTERQRQLLRMRYEENKTVSTIARELGVDKSTVSRTITRAKKRLYKCLRYGL